MPSTYLIRLPRILVGVIMLTAICGPAWADDNWDRLGQETLGRSARDVSIHVGVEEGWYRWIKLKAVGGRIDIRKVRVVFADGEKLDFDTFGVLVDGGETRPLPVSATFKRLIRRVEIKYDLGPNSGPVKLKVLGRRTD